MKAKREIASFLVRFTQDFWQDPEGEPRIEWRGHIAHVQDGDEMRFTELHEAMNFIQRGLFLATLRCVPQEDKLVQDKALRESAKLWEKFATDYTELVAERLQQTVKQSEVLQKHIAEAVEQVFKPWRPLRLSAQTNAQTNAQKSEAATALDQEQMVQALVAMQAQISLLTDKVCQLEATLAQQTTSGAGQI